MQKDYGEHFNVAHLQPQSDIYGPGTRFVVWLQGCSLACSGCWNKEMWSFTPRTLIPRSDLLQQILTADSIDGVTFLGGEPLHQADNLWWLIRQIREQSSKTIFVYTGYETQELRDLGQLEKLHELCDIVVTGRYEQQHRNTNSQWTGSDNQQVIYPLDSRESELPKAINQVEIHIDPNGGTNILGFPDTGMF